LISVKFTGGLTDYWSALGLIVEDIRAHPGRELQSVVQTSVQFEEGLTHEIISEDSDWQDYLDPIQDLLSLGVPFICSAGNEARTTNRETIDTFPPAAQDSDTPIIVVGAATYAGDRGGFSQYGPQVTIYGPGVDVECQTKDDKKSHTDSGTSLGKL
jgi:hypothetical protein